jgi:hypothetical protein
MRTLHIGLRVTDLGRSLAFDPGQEGDDGLRTTFVADPDGRRIELVQWPTGHPHGLTPADWPEERD